MRMTDAVITVSPNIAEWLKQRYSTMPPAIVLRNVPVRLRAIEGESLRSLARLTDERILLYTGRITTGRGLEEAIESLSLLPADVSLVMLGYGDGAYLEGLWLRAERLGVEAKMKLVSPVPSSQVPAVAAGADAALVAIQPVCLSYRFSLPNKLFEAIQAGVPVIATDLPDIASIVRGYGLGELYRPGDVSAFVEGVTKLLARRDEYRARAERAAKELCWENEQTRLLDLYASLERPDVLKAAR